MTFPLPATTVYPPPKAHPLAELAHLPRWTGKPAFPHVRPDILARELNQRIQDPGKINQSEASLCGPAAFLFSIAKLSPLTYARYILDLYKTGIGNLGKMQITPSQDCRNFNPTSKQMKGLIGQPQSYITGCDWIGLASLRDWASLCCDYQHATNQVRGITLPGEIAAWFRGVGFSSVVKDTHLIFDESRTNFFEACLRFGEGYSVCLFIGANGIVAPANSALGRWIGTAPADHWVVMTSLPRVGGIPCNGPASVKNVQQDIGASPLDFMIYTWGNQKRPINLLRNPVLLRDFLNYYYGYVAAKP